MKKTDTNAMGVRQSPRAQTNKKECIRCKRARWLLTFLMLASMAVILYLDQSAV